MSWDILSKTNLQYLLTRLKEVTDSIVRGHTIKNSSGTSMTSRDDLKFSGYLKTTDDSTNDCTIVSDEPISITWDNYQALTDVQRSGNKYLITDYPGGGGGGGSSELNDLTDVTISSPTNGQILQYNNANSKWVNTNLPQGGHTIITDGGTSLTSRDNLQAKGIYTHDDSTNGKTVMEVVREFNSVDDIEALTGEEAKGFQHIPDTVYRGRTASDIGFDKTGTSFNSTRVQDVLEEVDTDINEIDTELGNLDSRLDTVEGVIANQRQHIPFYTTYPNGRQAGSNTSFAVTIMCVNPSQNAEITEAYVYDANGNWTNILSSITSITERYNCIIVYITFSSTHAGKMLRLEVNIH